MATKRFSRLSIMLDAQDGMTKPLQNAAKATDQLQSRIAQLSSAFTSNSNSIKSQSVQQRVLAEGYQQLTSRISSTTTQAGLFAKMFQSLPAPIRLAAYEIEGIAKSLYAFATQNAVARTATTILTNTFLGLRAAVSNISWDIERGAKSLLSWAAGTAVVKGVTASLKQMYDNAKIGVQYFMQLTGISKGISLIGTTAKSVGNSIAQMSTNIKNAVTQSFGWQLTKTILTDVGTQIKLNATAFKIWIADLPYIAKGTTAWQAYSYAVAKAKEGIVSARLAFELWKNSSVAAESIANAVEKVGVAAKKLVSPFTAVYNVILKNITGLKNFNTATNNAGTRGRAAFNQLVDSNARLNAQLDKMNSKLEHTNSLFGKLSHSMSVVASIEKARIAAEAVVGTYERLKEPVVSMVETAAEQQQVQANYSIIAGSKSKGTADYKTVMNWANGTQFSNQQWTQAEQAYLRQFKSQDQLLSHMQLLEQMATFRPVEGLQGANRAVQEFTSGNVNSMAIRFGVNKQDLNKMKKESKGDLNKSVKLLSDYFGSHYGFTSQAVQQMKLNPQGQLETLKTNSKFMWGQLGQGILNSIMPDISKLNLAFKFGGVQKTVDQISQALGRAATSALNFGKALFTTVTSSSFLNKLKPIKDFLGQIFDGLTKSWPNIKATFADIGDIISKFFAQFTGGKGNSVSQVIQDIFKAIKDVADFINKNFKSVETVTSAFLGGMMAWKGMMFIEPMITGIVKGLKLLRDGELLVAAAQAIMDATNPFGWIALGVTALVAAGIALAMNWDKVKSTMVVVWGAIKTAAQDALNFIIDGINSMIDLINKIPGVSIPLVAKVDWSNTPAGGRPITGSSSVLPTTSIPKSGGGSYTPNALGDAFRGLPSHRTGLNNVPYDGYTAVLHKDERVLTAQQNKDYNKPSQGISITGNTFNVRQESDIDKIAESLYRKLYQAKTATG